MGMLLTREELRELTGSPQRATQRRELEVMGIPYRLRSDGWPAVDRRAYYQAMGAEAANEDRPAEAVLDLGAI